MTSIAIVDVFSHRGEGGNPCPIVTDAGGLSADQMRGIARRFGHESGFVVPVSGEGADLRLRFFVPNHEMEMCGHATIGALWQLVHEGRLDAEAVRIETLSGPVTGFVGRAADGTARIEITQPAGTAPPLSSEHEHAVLQVLGLGRADLLDLPLRNGATSRVKTLVPLRDPDRLNAVTTDMAEVEAVCRAIGSTGLYPFAPIAGDGQAFEARQFPRSSGYPEDAATGIAAAALAFGLLRDGLVAADDRPIRVFQGRAMGRLSEIGVRLGFAAERAIGCLLGGDVTLRETVRAPLAA